MDGIKKLIDEDRLEEAKDKITQLENRLTEEKAKHTQMMLIEQIRELKKLYIMKNQPNASEIERASNVSIPAITPRFESNERKQHVKNLRAQSLEPLKCIEATLENCTDIDVLDIQCEHSLLLVNVRNSKISCKAQQIRLIGCSNVILEAFTETGIFLQESTSILISQSPRFSELVGNNYKLVNDFTCPFSDENYRFEEPHAFDH